MSSVTVFVGGSPAAGDAAVHERVRSHPGAHVHRLQTATAPFSRHLPVPRARGPLVVTAPGLEDAFPDAQTGGTRLVLTHSAYHLQRWLDWLGARADAVLIAHADRRRLEQRAPEARARRGPWAQVELIELAAADEADVAAAPAQNPLQQGRDEPAATLAAAFRAADAAERVALCRRAADAHPGDAGVHLALGSALMEVRDLDASEAAIGRALAVDPDWEAAHYELGKLLLRRDDVEGASRAFAQAGRLMPTFAAAFSNLGAALGELGQREAALHALERALELDPRSHTTMNNLGVVARELGRLPDAEAAFRQVVAAAPEFVFGHYNLGHTLFLQGRYQAAAAAYAEGQRRDPERNPRQACRLAVARLAAGDPDGAMRDLHRAVAALPAAQKQDVLAEAQEILWALLTDRPQLEGWKRMADAVRAELGGI